MHPHYLKKVANRQMFKAYYFNIQTSRYMHEKKIRNSSFRTHEKIAKKTFKFNAESVIPTFFFLQFTRVVIETILNGRLLFLAQHTHFFI